MFRFRMGLLLALSVSVVAVSWMGCSDDKCVGTCARPTISNIWPNEDGRFWAYEVTSNIWDDVGGACDTLRDCDDNPLPLPSWDLIEAFLDEHELPDSMTTTNAVYGLVFAGDTTSHSGVIGQNLRESLVPVGNRIARANRGCGIPPLVARLYMARPDLRSAIQDRFGVGLMKTLGSGGIVALLNDCLGPECPLLIHGYVWKKTEDWIGTYGDADTMLAWKFLEADLSAGHEFTHQLVPSLTDDVFLHCKVLGNTRVTTEYRRFPNGLDCLYIVDYGSWAVRGPGGEELGCCRVIDYGRVIYVPEIGPVSSYERMLVTVGEPLGLGVGERILSLTDTGLPLE